MPKRKKQGKRSASKAKSADTERSASLTWDDVDVWAMGRSMVRGRTYQRQGRVKDLAVAEDGRLLATVQGGDPRPARRSHDRRHPEVPPRQAQVPPH